jgi:phage terminase large subunit
LELGNYIWDTSKDGKRLNKPVDDFNHFLDCFRYAMEVVKKSKKVKAAKSIY